MNETMRSVNEWVNATFGQPSSNFRVASRANEELAEALRAIAAGKPDDDVVVECADTIIVLCRLAEGAGQDWARFHVDPRIVPATYDTVAQYLAFANIQMARLLAGLAVDDAWPDTGDVVNKIFITLQYAMRKMGFDPGEAITGKMLINHGRQWGKSGDGTGYHVRRGPNAGDQVATFMGMGVFLEKDTSAYVRDKLLERLSAPDKVTIPCTGACMSRGCNCERAGQPVAPGGGPMVTDAVAPDPHTGTGKIAFADRGGKLSDPAFDRACNMHNDL